MSDQVVKGVHVGAGVKLLAIETPGAFQFQGIDCKAIADPEALPAGEELWLEYRCPRDGKICGGVFIGKGHKPADGPSWNWDGNVYAPTLTPSINCKGGCGWHGYLTAGEFVPC